MHAVQEEDGYRFSFVPCLEAAPKSEFVCCKGSWDAEHLAAFTYSTIVHVLSFFVISWALFIWCTEECYRVIVVSVLTAVWEAFEIMFPKYVRLLESIVLCGKEAPKYKFDHPLNRIVDVLANALGFLIAYFLPLPWKC